LLRLDRFPRPDIFAITGFCDDVTIDVDHLTSKNDSLNATGDSNT
jgi:hypothetical protein